MKFKCPKCQVGSGIQPSHYGKTIQCPKCSAKLRIPEPQSATDDPFGLPSSSTGGNTFDPLSDDPFADGQVQSTPVNLPARKNAKRKKTKSNKKTKLWIGLSLAGLLFLGFVYIVVVNVMGFLSAFESLEYSFKPEQTYSYSATLTVPSERLNWSADIDFVRDLNGKITYSTNMKSAQSSFRLPIAEVSPLSETGSFDLPGKGFGGFIELQGTHRFPFFMGSAATAPVIRLGPGKNWSYQQKLSLPIDRPMFGMQAGDTLNAMWKSEYTVKFRERNQTVIIERRTVEQTDGELTKILDVSGEHIFDDRSGLVQSKMTGTYTEPGGGLQLPFEFQLND